MRVGVNSRSVDAYLVVANDLLPGIKTLSLMPIHPRGCAMLAAHSLECILKSLLLFNGVNETEIYNAKTRHNLECLWRMAFSYKIDTKIPMWVCLLSFMHNSPYYGRYQQGQSGNVVDTGTYPPLVSTALRLEWVLRRAKKMIGEGTIRAKI